MINALNNELVSRPEFIQYKNTMAEKLDDIRDKIADLTVLVTALPKKIIDEADKKYASKETLNDKVRERLTTTDRLERSLSALETCQNKRTYDWLRYVVVASVGSVMTIVTTLIIDNIRK